MSISRAERILQTWVGEKLITQAGKDWLVAAVDPFHDTLLKDLQGWPDLEVSASVVRCIKQTMAISATSGGAAVPGAPWDCHLALLPWLSGMPFYASTGRSGNVATFVTGGAATPNIGGICAVAQFASGTAAVWPPVVGTSYLNSLTLDNSLTSGMGRVIGIGFEVVDTTAELYKQGQCIVYRQSQYPKASSTFTAIGTGTASIGTFDGTEVRLPPSTPAQAMLFPGSRQWSSAEGCYIVGAFHSNENPPFAVDYHQPVLAPCTFEEVVGVMPTQQMWFPTPASSGFASNTIGVTTAQPIHMNPIHQSGAIFYGLNPQSSLSITMNVYYESFPSVADTKTLVLATPSAEFDPMALNIYSHAVGLMPVGVMVKENGFGEWFRDVVQQIGNVASWIPHPIAQGVASAAKGGVKLMDGFMAPPSPMERKKKKLKHVVPTNAPAGNALVKKPLQKNLSKKISK